MIPSENEKILEKFHEIRDEILSVVDKDLSKRLETIEKTLYLGNGRPAVIDRLASVESTIHSLDQKIDSIVENTRWIPVIKIELDSVKEWQHNKDETRKNMRIEKWGGIYQAIGAIITMVLGTVVGLYVASPSDVAIEEAVKKALNKAEPVRVFEVNHGDFGKK